MAIPFVSLEPFFLGLTQLKKLHCYWNIYQLYLLKRVQTLQPTVTFTGLVKGQQQTVMKAKRQW